MMGTAHSATGAAIGFTATCAYLSLSNTPADLSLLTVGTLTGAGAALLPDLDHHQSTATRSLGPITQLAAWILRALSRLAHWGTRTRYDDGDGAHRHLTHTILFSLIVGALLAWGSATWTWFAFGTVWFTTSLALRGATGYFAPSVRQRSASTWLGVSAGAAVLAWVLVWEVGTSAAYLGVSVALGMIVHSLGDALTKEAAPFLWPVKIRGKRWYDIGMPARLRFTTGSPVEVWITRVSWAVPVVGSVLILV